jgi:acetylornithine deacetylase/succinyl-diaminopimelate desuccinylase-like protein
MQDGLDLAATPAEAGISRQKSRSLEDLTQEPALRACLESFRRNRDWINEQHLAVCRVAAPTFREQARAEHILKLFRELGYRPGIDDAGNVILPISFGPGQRFVAVTAHMDTVLAPRSENDIRIRADGTFVGPGVTDNGSGLAALIALARVLKDHAPLARPRCNVVLVANVAEEGEGNLQGMNFFCRHSRFASLVDAYLILDGASTGHITAEALGSRRFEIVIEGAGGHSWNDYGRANPVHALGRAVAALADLRLPPSPRTTLTVGVIEGGSGINSIAPLARAKVDIRSRDAAAMIGVVKSMERAVRIAVEAENAGSAERPAKYRIREIGHRPAAPLQGGNPVPVCVKDVDTYLGIHSRMDCASTDANVPLALGRPAVAIGAGGRGGGAHSPDEWYHPDGRELGLQRVFLSLALLLENPPIASGNGNS